MTDFYKDCLLNCYNLLVVVSDIVYFVNNIIPFVVIYYNYIRTSKEDKLKICTTYTSYETPTMV